jgi:hypothetical protein
MLARVYVVLPFTLDVVVGEQFIVREFKECGYQISIFPPVKVDGLSDQRLFGCTLKSANRETVGAQALHIHFRKNDFVRFSNVPRDIEPPNNLILKVANSFLTRLRVVTSASFIQPIDENDARWMIEYLNDDETTLPPEDGKLPSSSFTPIIINNAIIDAYSWERIHELPPHYEMPPWQTLLLDARDMWRDPGPALVLAATAHETLIQWALDKLAAKSDIPVDLWSWIKDRGDFRKEASVSEKFDILLKTLGGRSLKEDNILWECFTQTRDARNSFVHEGLLTVDKGNKKQVLTVEKARKLVDKAGEIATFVRDTLPEAEKWPIYNWDPKISLHLPEVSANTSEETTATPAVEISPH